MAGWLPACPAGRPRTSRAGRWSGSRASRSGCPAPPPSSGLHGHPHLAQGHLAGGEVEDHRRRLFARHADTERIGGEARIRPGEGRDQRPRQRVDGVDRHQSSAAHSSAHWPMRPTWWLSRSRRQRQAVRTRAGDTQLHGLVGDHLAVAAAAVDHDEDPNFPSPSHAGWATPPPDRGSSRIAESGRRRASRAPTGWPSPDCLAVRSASRASLPPAAKTAAAKTVKSRGWMRDAVGTMSRRGGAGRARL